MRRALIILLVFFTQTSFALAAAFEERDYRLDKYSLKNSTDLIIDVDEAKNLPSKQDATNFPSTADSAFFSTNSQIPYSLRQQMRELGIYTDTAKVIIYDLNNDKRDDAVVLTDGRNWCGSGGCTVYVFKNELDDASGKTVYKTLLNNPTSRTATILSDEFNGWKVLRINTSSAAFRNTIKEFVFAIEYKYYNEKKSHPKSRGKYKQIRQVENELFARNAAENSFIYQQDGKNLKLVQESYIKDCPQCDYFVYSMEHYGDPFHIYFIHVGVERGTPFVMEVTTFPLDQSSTDLK